MENPMAMAEVSASSAAAAAVNDGQALAIADFVVDNQPSAFLKLTMSRRIKEALIAEPKLRHFLIDLLAASEGEDDAESAVQRVVYSASARRTVLVEFLTLEQAAMCRERLHNQPCALLQGRAMYVEFALPRKEKEARDQLQRVPSVSRAIALSDPSARVPGLQFTPEFISKAQEHELLAFFDRDGGKHWENTVRARQVQHFGFVFNYETRRCDLPESGEAAADDALAMPPLLSRLVQQIVDADAMGGHAPDQITVNEYLPGQGIASHIDTHAAFTTAIASLSLENEIVMEFRRPDSDGVQGVEPVLLPPRSLVVMTGASRYEWTHAIQPRLFDVIDGARVDRKRRLSITFRKVQTTPCTCTFPVQCTAQEQFEVERLRKLRIQEQQQQEQEAARETHESLAPTAVEKEFVHAFYETVADHFSSTRYNPWPRIKQFVQSLPFGSVIADLGCGNGKYMLCVDPTQSVAVGGDRSARLAQICGARGLNALVCDAMHAPIRSASCDAALSIAVLHHLSTEHHRVAAVKEVIRVLRAGGSGVIYAWAHEQQRGSRRRFEEDRQDFMVPWSLDKRFVRKDGSGNDASEGEVQEKSSTAAVVQRFCHMFKQGELEQLVALAGGAKVEESYYDESNWAVVLRRIS